MNMRAATMMERQQLRATSGSSNTSAWTQAPGRCRCTFPSALRTVKVHSYDVDVEAERRSAPNSAPGGGWGAPPPPPPPPPPPRTSMQAPNRREALFGFLGAGIGVALTATYYNTTYDLSEDSYFKALDALLDDDDFLSTVSDELVYRDYSNALDKVGIQMDAMVDLDTELKKLQADLERLSEDEQEALKQLGRQ